MEAFDLSEREFCSCGCGLDGPWDWREFVQVIELIAGDTFGSREIGIDASDLSERGGCFSGRGLGFSW
jgi:hypothetical protein